MNITFIRHGKTEGNRHSKFVGSMDEPLCQSGIRQLTMDLNRGIYPRVSHVFTTAQKRAMQTVKIIYSDVPRTIIEDLRECDFGTFEGLSRDELDGLPDYRQWLRNGCMGEFPGGEDPMIFRARCVEAFERCIKTAIENKYSDIAFVMHTGSIMAILESFSDIGSESKKSRINNGCGWTVYVNEETWQEKHSLVILNEVAGNLKKNDKKG